MCTGPGSGQGQSPRIFNRLRDFRGFVPGSTRRALSRRSAPSLSRVSASASSRSASASAPARRASGRAGGRRRCRAGLSINLVGEQQRREQQLARFATGAEARQAPRGSWRRPARAAARRFSSSPARQATRYLRPAMVRSTSAISAPPRISSVELGDGFAHLGAQLLVARTVAWLSRGRERPLDALQRALGAVESWLQDRRRPCESSLRKMETGRASIDAERLTDQRARPIGPPSPGARPDPADGAPNAADPTPTCQCHSRTGDGCGRGRQSAAIPACRWAWPTPRPPCSRDI